MIDLIGQLSDSLSISRDIAAQLVISFLGTFLALVATVAAWMATRIAKVAAEEAREARFEQVRPIFELVPSNSKMTVRWEKSNCFVIFDGGSSTHANVDENFRLFARNIGRGTAIDLRFEVGRPASEDISEAEWTELSRVFDLGELEPTRFQNTISFVHGAGASGVSFGRPKSWSSKQSTSCGVGDEMDYQVTCLVRNEICEIATRSLTRAELLERFQVSKDILIRFFYSSVLDERREIPFLIRLKGSHVNGYGVDSYEPDVPTKPWDTLDVEVSVSILKLRPIRKRSWADRNNPKQYFDLYVQA